jgi:cytochrome c oxidase subunit 1
VLVQDLTGIGSIFGARFSKIVFAGYLVFVPPTSLYHMFLEPGLAEPVRVLGSILSLFIGVPTVAVFLVIVSSLEAHARARGARGLFGWLKLLPWRDPAMSAIGMAVVNLAFGGALAFVLIQEKLAQLLSDTFFVPGYFHFLTLGTVTLTMLAALSRVLPALASRPLPAPRWLAAMPYLVTAGLLLFGGAGTAAGLLGMPRRVLDAGYDGAAPGLWAGLALLIGIGGAIMAGALAVQVILLARALLASGLIWGQARLWSPPLRAEFVAPPMVLGEAAMRQAAWTGPLSVALLIAALSAATALAFTVLRALPLAAIGGGGH